MKKIGIVGGMGPESTLEYYRGIIGAFHSTFEESGYPEIAIESCDFKEMLSYSRSDRWQALADVIAGKFNWLCQAGCDFGVIASNTPHKVFKEIQRQCNLPLVSIVEATCDYAGQKKVKKLVLLGTGFTMRSDFYQTVFNEKGIELFTPAADEIEYIHEKIFAELEFAVINPETRKGFLTILDRVTREKNCEGAIMGCTELPMIIKPGDIPGLYLDSTAIHIEKIVKMCTEN